MNLHIPTMSVALVDFAPDGRVRFENENWSTPTLQETRAIIHAAEHEIQRLQELIAALEK